MKNIEELSQARQQALDHFIVQNALLNDLCAVLGLNLDVLDDLVTLLDTDQGAQFAEALAAGLLNADDLVVIVTAAGGEYQLDAGSLLYDLFENLMNLVGAGGDTAGTGANQDSAIIFLDCFAGRDCCLSQFFRSLNHQPLPLNSAMSAIAFSGVMEG